MKEIDWNEVKKRLEKRDKSLYYAGGTLSVSLDDKRFVALNLDGGGFDQDSNKLEQPDFILEMTKAIYLETKGETKHYKETIYA